MTPTRRVFAEMLTELGTIKLAILGDYYEEDIRYLSDMANIERHFPDVKLEDVWEKMRVG